MGEYSTISVKNIICNKRFHKKSTLQAAVKEIRLGSATIGDFTLRMRKTGKLVEPALVTLQFADPANN